MKAGKDGPMKKNFPGAFKIGSSTGMSGAQGRAKMKKPMAVDIDGNPVTEGGRRNYNDPPAFSMKSPKKAKAKKGTAPGSIAVYNDQGQIHAKYMPGDMGYDQAKLMLQNQPSPNQMKSPKKMKAKAGALKKKSPNKVNPGFDKLPKDVQAKMMKNKK